MSKIKKQLLAGPYLIWIIGFIILPLFMIVYYAFKGSDGGFTFEYVAAIAQHTNIKALLLSLRLGIICTIICLVLSYPLSLKALYVPVEREASPFNLGFGVVEGEYY